MATDWRTAQAVRDVQAKRGQLAALNATIEQLDDMLGMARAFEGDFAERLSEANRRAFEVAPRVDVNRGQAYSYPFYIRPDHHDEHERRKAVVQQIERERDEERARRTTTSHDAAGFTLTFCELDPGDVLTKRARAVIRRDQAARELAEIEAQMTPGQIVESGVPAQDYAEHRERVAALRQRVEAAS